MLSGIVQRLTMERMTTSGGSLSTASVGVILALVAVLAVGSALAFLPMEMVQRAAAAWRSRLAWSSLYGPWRSSSSG